MAAGLPYSRIDTERAELAQHGEEQPGDASASSASPRSIRWAIIPLSMALCLGQVVLTILAENFRGTSLTPTLISVIAFGLLMLGVLLNPCLAATRWIRPLTRAELVCLFTSLLVTSGISTFGLAAQLVPLIPAPWNPEWNTPQRQWSEDLLPRMNPALYLDVPTDASPEERRQALADIRAFREGLRPTDSDGRVMSAPLDGTPPMEHVRYGWRVFLCIPWWTWSKAIAAWLIFVAACYGMFYALVHLVFDNWDRREKLSFPLARLPQAILPEEGQPRRCPAMLKTWPFWMAFLVSAAILSWNGLAEMGLLGGLNPIRLGMGAARVAAVLQDTPLDGLATGRFRLLFLIIFTAVGIAFLLPLEISFSVWFYYLIAQLILFLAIKGGWGAGGTDFPTDMLSTNNLLTAQAFGGIMLFSVITLGRSVRQQGVELRSLAWSQRVSKLAPLLGLIASMTVMVLWLRWNQSSLPAALLVAVFLMLLTVGLMRIVAETGIFWFQAHAGPFHFFNVFGLSSVISPALMAPLLPVCSVLFFDLKTFLAPNLLHASKLHADVGGDRRRFHLNLLACLLVSVIAALALSIFLAHLHGAQRMNNWFFSSAPQAILDNARQIAQTPPGSMNVNAAWFTGGAAWTAITLLLRRSLFWFPHPVGYIMLISPLINSLWFSFLIGWAIKRAVVKYGGKSTFDLLKPAFVGLIAGELTTILVWSILGIALNFTHPLTLNRLAM